MSQFTEVKYSKEFFNSILFNIFNNNEKINIFLNLINHQYISISGSSILQTIKEKKYDNSDLDIYIEIDKMTFLDIIELIKFLHYEFNFDTSFDNYNLYINKLYYMFRSYLYNVTSNVTLNSTDEWYPSLRKYLKLLLTFKNQNNKKIELIFISKNIEIILLNTFDYDIVKNYWKQGIIFCNNLIGIAENIATMSLTHFINRICINKSKQEFDNFIKRYLKYTKRGYQLFIHKTKITNHIIKYIINIYKSRNYIDYIEYDNNGLFYNRTINNVRYECIYIYIYIINKLNFEKEILEKKSHLIKYILLAGVYQKYKFRKNIIKYSNYILDEYLNPNSPYVIYTLNKTYNKYINNIKDNNINKEKKIYYISNNNLKQFVLNK